jgi:hypothetical protein
MLTHSIDEQNKVLEITISEIMINVLPYEAKIFENDEIEEARAWLK